MYFYHLTGNLCFFLLLRLWLLKCCKDKNLCDMKIYFHSLKITLYLIKYIFIMSPLFSWYQSIFYWIKINLYSIKFIFIISTFFFHDIKIYFYSFKIILYSVRSIFIKFFFHSSKVYFYYMNFLLNTFLVSISDLPFVFIKVRILLSVCKLNNNTKM